MSEGALISKLAALRRRLAFVLTGFLEAADAATLVRMVRLRIGRHLPPLRIRAESTELRMRGLSGGALHVRAGTTDLDMALHDYRGDFHLPPEAARDQRLRCIVELGCNAGAALTWYATRYPHARLLGVEPDPANARQARCNVERFGGRCEVVEAAVWSERAALTLAEGPAHSIRVQPPTVASDTCSRVPALGITELLDRYLSGEAVDFMMISVEGSEREALAGDGSWADRVAAVRLELNTALGGPSPLEAEAILSDLGYTCWSDDRLGGSSYGVKGGSSPLRVADRRRALTSL